MTKKVVLKGKGIITQYEKPGDFVLGERDSYSMTIRWCGPHMDCLHEVDIVFTPQARGGLATRQLGMTCYDVRPTGAWGFGKDRKMSADNAIFVQKRLDGDWWVWMGLGDDREVPIQGCRSFSSEEFALCYAQGWSRGEDIVEYGVQVLDEQTEEEEYTKAVCPCCGQLIALSCVFIRVKKG